MRPSIDRVREENEWHDWGAFSEGQRRGVQWRNGGTGYLRSGVDIGEDGEGGERGSRIRCKLFVQ